MVLLLACTGVAITALDAWQSHLALRMAHEQLAASQTQARNARRHEAAARPKPVRPVLEMQRWRQLALQLNTPWAGLLDALEATTPDTVALVAIEPDAQQGNVRLTAEAKTLDTLLAYAAKLQTAQAFQDVTLIKHETNDQDASHPLRLSVSVRLRGNASATQTATAGPAQ